MKILVIADPMVSIPPEKYGGSERMVDLMCRGLVQQGHAVHLLAGPGSRDYGGGLTVHRPPAAAWASRTARKLWFQFLVVRAARGAQVVINHARLDYLEVLYRTRTPIIHWFHVPLTGQEVPFVTRRRSQGDHFVGVSRSQVANDPSGNRFHVIPNAIDTASVPFGAAPTQPSYLLFLGQLTENKGVHLAMAAARRAGLRLVLGGKVPQAPGAAEFFECWVKPGLGRDCEWIGVYDEQTRNRLVAGAMALLFPIQAPEAFGLVMIEALAGGLPVVAFRKYSTPEVVEHGRNGFLCDSIDEMVGAIQRVGEISREECRASVERRFSASAFRQNVGDLIARVAPSE